MKIDQIISENYQTCSECGGPAFSDLLLAEKKDACYNKVRSRYKVWPSAYASGALVQCRKKGADNWGNKSESVNEAEPVPGKYSGHFYDARILPNGDYEVVKINSKTDEAGRSNPLNLSVGDVVPRAQAHALQYRSDGGMFDQLKSVEESANNPRGLDENLADEFMAMARAKGYNPRLAGTPDQERARTDAMLAQRAADRAAAPAPAAVSDEERAGLESKLQKLQAEFDPDYEFSDDHSFWKQQSEIAQQISYIKQKLSQGVAEDSLNEFAPGSGGGESGRWYTDDQMTDIVGDGWWQDLDVSGNIPKQAMIQEAQAWLDDQGYRVQVLNCKVNDDDMEWFIEGSFQNSRFAKKSVTEGEPDLNWIKSLSKEKLDALAGPRYKKQSGAADTDPKKKQAKKGALDLATLRAAAKTARPASDLDKGSLNEFAPAGSGGGNTPRGPRTPGGDDGSDDDPYSRPEPEYYSRSLDFFGRFEADHFDDEEFDKATGVFRGYWDDEEGRDQIAYFKFDNPQRTGDDDPGMGWYYEPQSGSNDSTNAPSSANNTDDRKKQELGMISAFLKSGQTPNPGSQIYQLMKRHGMAEGQQEKEADYGPDYQDMVARVKKLAGLGPLKTVWDPQKRVYKNVPRAVQPGEKK